MPDATYTLVAVETASIQSYIFTSNRLRENVGASYLVRAATDDWAEAIAREVTGQDDLYRSIADGQVEKIYSGGGNIVLLFQEEDKARQFIRELSRAVLKEAPGLKLTFSKSAFSWGNSLCDAVGKLLQDMKKLRSQQPALRGDAGQGVNIMGRSTSMPAVEMQQDPDGNWQPISAETRAKRKFAPSANDLLREDLVPKDMRSHFDEHFTFADELDDLGRSEGETSYIAVVHADGNGLGVFIQGLKEKYTVDDSSQNKEAQKNLNREYITFMRGFSHDVTEVAQQAQQVMVRQIMNSVEGNTLYGVRSRDDSIVLKERDNRLVFPIRPLVSGGDDVTFICDGRIGIDLAITFLKAFEAIAAQKLDNPMSACAGIAIVKTHYPFARAYNLAEELTSSAKQASYQYDHKPAAFDWHITSGGLYGDLEALREREYQVEEGHLTLRPLFVKTLDEKVKAHHETWQTVETMLKTFQTKWRPHRNKAEALRTVLRKGAVETAIYKVRYLSDSQSPELPAVAGFDNNGWKDGYCGYYDALELMDKYIPLKIQEVR